MKLFLKGFLDFEENLDNLNGKKLFELNKEDMEKLGMKLGQRRKLIRYINNFQYKRKKEVFIEINKDSPQKDFEKFLSEKLYLSKKTIEFLGFDKDAIFSMKNEDIDLLKIPDREKENLKLFIKAIKLKQNKIEIINDNTKINVFIIICTKENYFQNINISFFSTKEKDTTKKKCQYRILNKMISNNVIKDDICELFLIKIELDDLMDDLYINIQTNNNEFSIEKLYINKTKNISNFFYFDDLFIINSDLFKDMLFNIPTDIIFNEFYKFIFGKKSNNKELYEKNMIESLFEDIRIKIKLDGNNILRVMKCCFKYKLQCFCKFDRINFSDQKKITIEKESIISDDEIEFLKSFKLNINGSLFQYILNIYIIYLKDKIIFSDLFEKSKYQKEFYKAFLDLFREKIIIPKDLFFLQEKAELFQIFILDEIKEKKVINKVIEISQYLENALSFINKYYSKIIQKLNNLNNYSYYNYLRKDSTNFKISTENIEINDDINLNNIMTILNQIIKTGEEKSYHLINYEELFRILVIKLYSKDINKYYLLQNFIPIIEKYIQPTNLEVFQQDIEMFYEKVHIKGINLIIKKKWKLKK